MAREILFKAKREDNGEWIYGSYLSVVQFDNSVVSHCIAENKSEYDPMQKGNVQQIIKVDPNTICQYTGLQDKNGTKIFEGDLIEFSNPSFKKAVICEVIYHEEEARFDLLCLFNKDFAVFCEDSEFGVVIGNKFDNDLEVQDEQ